MADLASTRMKMRAHELIIGTNRELYKQNRKRNRKKNEEESRRTLEEKLLTKDEPEDGSSSEEDLKLCNVDEEEDKHPGKAQLEEGEHVGKVQPEEDEHLGKAVEGFLAGWRLRCMVLYLGQNDEVHFLAFYGFFPL
ncbi:hypothetical protein RIF29_38553 [Crotalaria pallida]|uniref:Uncharacterized protein n=1 Tax=Crotalaria pallida TaxID=3830 RepID=A0AAN9E5R2_CROPI